MVVLFLTVMVVVLHLVVMFYLVLVVMMMMVVVVVVIVFFPICVDDISMICVDMRVSEMDKDDCYAYVFFMFLCSFSRLSNTK